MIVAKDLYFSYTGSPPFLIDGLNFTIRNGEYVSILGDNGSGKSTLLRLLLRFLKPTRGEIQCHASRIGYVPQKNDFSNSAFPITVTEALNAYRKLLRLKDRDAAEKALELTGMREYRNTLIGHLSGGQTQKVLISRALLGDPELLVLDEPSTGVDVASQKEIYGFISGLNRTRGITIVSVEHNLAAAIDNSTLIYHLAQGRGHLCTPEKYAAEFLNRGRSGGNV